MTQARVLTQEEYKKFLISRRVTGTSMGVSDKELKELPILKKC